MEASNCTKSVVTSLLDYRRKREKAMVIKVILKNGRTKTVLIPFVGKNVA